jgi:hypothetical protein
VSPDSAAERARRYRLRKAGQLPPAEPLLCIACGKTHRGAHGQLCRDCWRSLTPEGKADRAERVRRSRTRRKRDGM